MRDCVRVNGEKTKFTVLSGQKRQTFEKAYLIANMNNSEWPGDFLDTDVRLRIKKTFGFLTFSRKNLNIMQVLIPRFAIKRVCGLIFLIFKCTWKIDVTFDNGKG